MALLDGKVALVTGASRGIGAATAIALARHGAHVVITARDVAGLEQVEDAIFNAGGSATIAPLDLTEADSIARLASAISERWRALDVLVLNAGRLGSLSAVPAIDPKEMAAVLTLNVSAQAALIAAFDPMLRASGAGRVIGVTSSVGRDPRAFWGLYGASKAAFDTLLAAYADETEQFGLAVAVVDPGATRTRMRADAFPGEDPMSVKDPAIVGERIAMLAMTGFATGYRERVEPSPA